MKLSKKIMAGLMVGAVTISIWTPLSHAATPENNRYYSIHLKNNTNLVWDVYEGGTYDEAAILLHDQNSGDNQKFLFFPLDDGKYAIVNKNSGKPVVSDTSVGAWIADRTRTYNTDTLFQKSWTGDAKDQWYLRDQGGSNYEIVNQGYGKVASYGSMFLMSGTRNFVDLDESNPSDGDKVFYISSGPVNRGVQPEYGTVSLPQLPATGTRPNVPKYDASKYPYQQLPQTSNSVVVGASLVPCIMVNDSQASDYTKIHNSPYYILEKEEYWDKAASTVLSPGATQSLAFKTGMSSTDQQKMTETLSMKIGADFGLQFLGKIGPLKAEISKTIQTETSTSNSQVSEDTVTTTIKSDADKTTGYTLYQLATKYTLKRTDGTTVSGSWIVKNNKVTVLTDSNGN
jgi:hypothetical protein